MATPSTVQPVSDAVQSCPWAPVAALDALGVGLIVVDSSMQVRYQNLAATAMVTPAPTLEEALKGIHVLGPFEGWVHKLDEVRRAKGTVVLEAAKEAAERGSVQLLRLRCSPLSDRRWTGGETWVALWIEAGPPPGATASHVEVSRRLASLGKLASKVVHELNNPLDGILRYINLAIRLADSAPETKLKEYLAESRAGLLRMVQIIGDLLEFYRGTEGRFDESTVGEVVEEAVRACVGAAEANRVVVSVDLQSDSNLATRGSRLYQVCCNLIRNAIDAMPGGGRVNIRVAVLGPEVVVSVEDTGPGLPIPVERVFEPFFTTKHPGQGTGLGLSICKEFVEHMGGTIAARNAPQGGAEFIVRVPVTSLRAPARLGRAAGRLEN